MSYLVRLHPAVRDDLRTIVDYIADYAGELAAAAGARRHRSGDPPTG
ncbi:MAG: hypothetical protein R3D25_18045 [Geminicoccaceae bacterium]